MDVTALDKLSPEERKVALQILQDLSKGDNKSLNDLKYADYDEIPVDIGTFLHDPRYLGKGLTTDDGRFTLYPYWEQLLHKIYPDPLGQPRCNTLALTGSIGIGKSTEAVVIMCYELYRMLCLKNPYTHYGLQPIDLITFAVINITKDAAKGVAWSKLQGLIQSSEWFMSRGTVNRSDVPEWKPPKGIELIYGSQSRHIIGRAVFCCFQDEVSFQPNQDVEAQKLKARQLVDTAAARMQSRFMKGENNPTILMLASSKRTEQSFMESYIETKKKIDSKTTFIVDEPQWVIRTDKDSPRKFKVALGNKFLDSEVLPLDITDTEVQEYIDRGYSIIDVPMGYYENFIEDLDIALTDIAGISTSNVIRYIAGTRIAQIKVNDYENMFTKEIITVGDDEDTIQYYDFIDLGRVNPEWKSKPMYIHLDLSESGDKTGIAGVWIIGKRPHQEGVPDSKELSYRLAFSVAIKAPKGYRISFEKNRQLIYWLKNQGFNIKGVSTDTFQSFDTGQLLAKKGYNYSTISVDRVDSDRICKPYLALKNAIYEQRLLMYDNKHLTEELIGLERNNAGKIDHSPAGINSKDTADALCGALYNASLNAEEFAYEFGEDLDTVVSVSAEASEANFKQQVMIDFEEELKRMAEESAKQVMGDNPWIGQSTTDYNYNQALYTMQGILI